MNRSPRRAYTSLYHPFKIFIYKRHNRYQEKNYGFSFDTVNEFYYYKYEYGFGIRLRIIGFGFDITVPIRLKKIRIGNFYKNKKSCERRKRWRKQNNEIQFCWR